MIYSISGKKCLKSIIQNDQSRLRIGKYKVVYDKNIESFRMKQFGRTISLSIFQLKLFLQEICIILCEMRDIRNHALRKSRYLSGYLSINTSMKFGKPYLNFNKCRVITAKHPGQKCHIKEFGTILSLSQEQVKDIERARSNILDILEIHENQYKWETRRNNITNVTSQII